MSTLGRGGGSTGAVVPSYRPRIALPFGGGLDRATGIGAVPRNTMADLRNVHLLQGRIELRKGLTATTTFPLPGGGEATEILGGVSLRSENAGIVVASGGNGAHLFRIDGDGSSATHLAEWPDFPSGHSRRVIGAVIDTKVFFAHDEPYQPHRAASIVYDTIEADKAVAIEQEWAGPEFGDRKVRFRGVCVYRDFLIGWGFASNLFPNRQEFIRASMPGLTDPEDPDDLVPFRENHYFIPGVVGEPVLRCERAGGVLMVLKENEVYALTGRSAGDFGFEDADLRFGCPGSRLAVHHKGALFVWTHEGPRVTTGGTLEDLALPLDISGPTPADLVAEGALEDGFAEYLPNRAEILFVFGRRAYVLALGGDDGPPWSYREFGVPLSCGFILHGTSVTVGPSPVLGYAQAVGPDTFNELTATTARIFWFNQLAAGDELVDIFLRPAGGAWSLVASPRVNTGLVDVSAGGITHKAQARLLTGLTANTTYEYALRFRRGGNVGVGYAGSDPMAWTAATAPLSRSSFHTNATEETGGGPNGVPSAITHEWQRVSASVEQITFNWTNSDATAQTQILRGSEVVATLAPGVTMHPVVTTGGETWETYSLRHRKNGLAGAASAPLSVWVGPFPGPSNLRLLSESPNYEDGVYIGADIVVEWANGAGISAAPTVSIRNLPLNPADGDGSVVDRPLGTTTHGDNIGLTAIGAGTQYRVRGRTTIHGVTDYTPWSNALDYYP